MYTTEKTSAITPTSWFYNLEILSENETHANLPSTLQIVFLLYSGASTSVLKIPTYMMITQIFNVCNQHQHHTST